MPSLAECASAWVADHQSNGPWKVGVPSFDPDLREHTLLVIKEEDFNALTPDGQNNQYVLETHSSLVITQTELQTIADSIYVKKNAIQAIYGHVMGPTGYMAAQDFMNRYVAAPAAWQGPRCECGSETVYGPNAAHSSWCPLAK